MPCVVYTMDYSRKFTLDGSAPYVTYELKSAPFGLPLASYSVPRNPLNPTVPNYTECTAELRMRLHQRALQYMQRYPDISTTSRFIRAIASKKITNTKIDLTGMMETVTPYGEQLVEHPDELEEIEVENVSDSDQSNESSIPVEHMEPPRLSELPAVVFAALDALHYTPLSSVISVILQIAKNKIDIQDAREIVLSYNLTEISDVSGISRDSADRLIKALVCAVSGQTYTIDQFERATSRFLTQVYGMEVLPVFIMLLYGMV